MIRAAERTAKRLMRGSLGEPKYNHMTQSYEFRDGTTVSAELFDSVHCLADVFHISHVREQQRGVLKEKT